MVPIELLSRCLTRLSELHSKRAGSEVEDEGSWYLEDVELLLLQLGVDPHAHAHTHRAPEPAISELVTEPSTPTSKSGKMRAVLAPLQGSHGDPRCETCFGLSRIPGFGPCPDCAVRRTPNTPPGHSQEPDSGVIDLTLDDDEA